MVHDLVQCLVLKLETDASRYLNLIWQGLSREPYISVTFWCFNAPDLDLVEIKHFSKRRPPCLDLCVSAGWRARVVGRMGIGMWGYIKEIRWCSSIRVYGLNKMRLAVIFYIGSEMRFPLWVLSSGPGAARSCGGKSWELPFSEAGSLSWLYAWLLLRAWDQFVEPFFRTWFSHL